MKEDRGHGFVRWSRTLCERPDSIRGAQRGPGRQQGELKFWGLKPRFSCSSALVLSKSSCTARSTAFPVEAESEEQSLGLFTAKQALRAQLSSLRPDHARDFTGHSAPIFGGPPAERDPNAQHQGGALEARTSKEAGGFGVVRWSRTPCERSDSIRGGQRGPSRQQIELEFWGLKPQFSCASALVSSAHAFHCLARGRFLARKKRKSRFLGFLPQKSCRSTLTLMSRTTGRRNARDVYGFQRVLLRCLRAESETPLTSRLSGLNAITGRRGHISPVSYSGNLFRHSVSNLLSDCVQRRGTATSVFNFPSGQWLSGCAIGCSPYGLRAAGDEGQLPGATPKWMSVPCADQEIVRRRRPQ